MITKLIEEGGNKFLIVSVHPNIEEGFISKSGKSWVFRVKGTYVKANGDVIGTKGKICGYIHRPFGFTVIPIKKSTYWWSHTKNYDFGDDILKNAIKIPVKDIVPVTESDQEIWEEVNEIKNDQSYAAALLHIKQNYRLVKK